MISTSRCRCRFFSLWSTGGLHWCRLTRSCHTFGQQEGQSIATYQRRTRCWRQLEVLGFETWPEYGRSKMCIIDINYYNFSICYSFVAWKSWGFTISQFRSCFCLMPNCVEDKWFLNNIITIWLLRFIVSSLHMYYIITSLNCYVHFFRVKYGGLKLPLLWWVGIFGCLRRWRIAPHQRLGCTQRFNVYWLGSVLSTFYDLIQTSDL